MKYLYFVIFIIQVASLLLAQPTGLPTEVCKLPQASGVCFANIPSWFFNTSSAKCEAFVYGGCGGNANRFGTHEDCERFCGPLKNQNNSD